MINLTSDDKQWVDSIWEKIENLGISIPDAFASRKASAITLRVEI